ncbi:hypothetical protein BV898_03298 [Hypsibius exemplaris]|uniref:CUB domain-containing protein n=1 Tax=Hypsibius exemplaris TaxID=2072580 RepID=A0A1W0X5P1_HYPEX|nr:hypothetical protein BV898_03298 [Hypsibius exemplaris]
MAFALFASLAGVVIFSAPVKATSVDLMPGHADTSLLPGSRLLPANIDVYRPSVDVDNFTCTWTVPEKIEARYRSIFIRPDYNWLGKDKRVSVSIEHCTATLKPKNPEGEPIVADLIKGGKLTAHGQAVRLTLHRTGTPGHFAGTYIPFTVASSVPASIQTHHNNRIGAHIECKLVYCLVNGTPECS